MPKLSQLRYGLPTSVALTFDERGGHPWKRKGDEPEPPDIVHVTYNPGYKTSEYLAAIQKAYEPESTISPALMEFLAVVLEWDVDDEKGKRVPLEQKALEAMPIDLLHGVVGGVTEHLTQPHPTTAPS